MILSALLRSNGVLTLKSDNRRGSNSLSTIVEMYLTLLSLEIIDCILLSPFLNAISAALSAGLVR